MNIKDIAFINKYSYNGEVYISTSSEFRNTLWVMPKSEMVEKDFKKCEKHGWNRIPDSKFLWKVEEVK